MAKYTLVDGNEVVKNVVEWDGDTKKWTPPPGLTAHPGGSSIGYTRQQDGSYTPPPDDRPIAEIKTSANAEINAEVSRRISAGFQHAGMTFALDWQSQIQWLYAKNNAATDPAISDAVTGPRAPGFPVLSIDDSAVHVFNSIPEIVAAATAAVNTISLQMSAGRKAKTLVLAATGTDAEIRLAVGSIFDEFITTDPATYIGA